MTPNGNRRSIGSTTVCCRASDLGRAHRFYSTFMGGELDHLTNLTIRGLNREVPQILFLHAGQSQGLGLALQDFPIASTPARPLDGVVATVSKWRRTIWPMWFAPPKSASSKFTGR